MAAKPRWRKCPHCDRSVLRHDMEHDIRCKKEQERKAINKRVVERSDKDAFDKAKPW